MAKIFHIMDELDERSKHSMSEEDMLERAFKEGCEHGYKKAVRESGINERSYRTNYREGFEEKLEKLREKYR